MEPTSDLVGTLPDEDPDILSGMKLERLVCFVYPQFVVSCFFTHGFGERFRTLGNFLSQNGPTSIIMDVKSVDPSSGELSRMFDFQSQNQEIR